jgi:hypothetical protein
MKTTKTVIFGKVLILIVVSLTTSSRNINLKCKNYAKSKRYG